MTPALRCSRPNLVEQLKDGGRGASGSIRGTSFRRGLVIAEVGLAVILLAAASLAIRNFAQLLAIDPGFQVDRTLLVHVPLPPQRYQTIEQRNGFARKLLDNLATIPGIESVALGNGGMPFGGNDSSYAVEGQLPETDRKITVDLISSDYLRTLGIALKRGRPLSALEVFSGAHVALINETAAKLWKGRNPLGEKLRVDALTAAGTGQVLMPPHPDSEVTIVGMIADTRNAGLRDATVPAVSVPYTLVAPPTRMLAIRTSKDPMLILNTVRRRVQALDEELPLSRPMTLKEVLGFETVAPRFVMALFSCFAGLGLALAAAGIFSVISYDVSQKVHEIGVRVALGATRSNVVFHILGSAGKVISLGLLIGLAGSLVTVRLIRSQLFSNTPFDMLSIFAIAFLLSTVALMAALVPALRAGRMAPSIAMRHEL